MLIYLIGAPASGKSTYGKELAVKLNFNFIDTDDYIEDKEQSTISEIFKNKGEKHFRSIEHKYILEISKNKNTIIATGGGLPCYNNNIDIILQTGTSIYLKQNTETLIKNLAISGGRPLTNGKNNIELKEYLNNMLNKREIFYLKANHTVENANTNTLFNLIKYK